jgi:hypothetical protein
VRSRVAALCILGGVHRDGALERVSGAANAYKHGQLNDKRHPITSDGDILAVGAGFGVDGFGIGKFGGVEVMLMLKDGTQRKFLGDVPYSIAGWLSFLKSNGATLPHPPIVVCARDVSPP